MSSNQKPIYPSITILDNKCYNTHVDVMEINLENKLESSYIEIQMVIVDINHEMNRIFNNEENFIINFEHSKTSYKDCRIATIGFDFNKTTIRAFCERRNVVSLIKSKNKNKFVFR